MVSGVDSVATMAMPISPGEIYEVAKFAYGLWRSCKAAPSEFQQIGKEVFAMRTVVEIVHIECQDPDSIINLVDNKKPERLLRKRLGIYIRNCDEALKAVDALLKKYERMGTKDKVIWALKGKSEVTLLEADLSSFASQLDSYVEKITLNGVGLVNENVISGIGRLEDLLEKYIGNETQAVTQVMQERRKSVASKREPRRLQKLMEDYAQEMSQFANNADGQTEGSVRPRTPDPPRNRHNKNDHLGVPKPERVRRNSADAARTTPNHKTPRRPSNQGKKPWKPNYTLECWLIRTKSAQALFVTFELSEKESQCRGQWKLREMSKQFNGSKDKLAGNHDLVKWVVKDRNKKEEED